MYFLLGSVWSHAGVLAPAGSHGVWGLDFPPFPFGSARLRGHKYLRPKAIRDNEVVDELANDYMYFACIKLVKSVKTWDEVNTCTIRTHKAEVLGKLPVMEHSSSGLSSHTRVLLCHRRQLTSVRRGDMSMKDGVTVVGYLSRVLLLLRRVGRKGSRSRGLGVRVITAMKPRQCRYCKTCNFQALITHDGYHVTDRIMEAGKKRRLPYFGKPPSSAPNLTPSRGEPKILSGSIVSNAEKSGHDVKKKLRAVISRLVPFHREQSSSSAEPIATESAEGDSEPPVVIQNDSHCDEAKHVPVRSKDRSATQNPLVSKIWQVVT
ncbi:hypothetical protein EDD15DRAFT_2197862 [Pisolithus albus]|nr:hypothetical protein EDD15DRAFT_2197862 [Pisolithus albus]